MDAEALAAKRVGSTLKGKYVLEELLAVGGMAAVYRGRHRNGNRVAIKVLHASICQQMDLRDRFAREGCVANKVDHHGAVRVLDDDATEDGSVFLVMELLDGETVAARWKRAGNRLPYREVAQVGIQLLDVLAAAHNQGIVHRDIKPENLFLTSRGSLKVLDFGIARLRDLTSLGTSSATRTGHMLGTPAYMPPEQVIGRPHDISGQTDVWATGATMFALISGKHVHEAASVAELLVYAGSRSARPLASVAPEVPSAIGAVIDRALAYEKADRWPNARAMQAALQAALDNAEAPAQASMTEVMTWAPLRSTAPTSRSLRSPPNTSTTAGLASVSRAGAPGLRVRTNAPIVIVGTTALVVAAASFVLGMRERTEPRGHQAAAATASVVNRASVEAPRTPDPPPSSNQGGSTALIPAVAAEALPIAHPVTPPVPRPPRAPAPSASADHDNNPYLDPAGAPGVALRASVPTRASQSDRFDNHHEINPYLYRSGVQTTPAASNDGSR
jgi:serine/threonine-protein kinase